MSQRNPKVSALTRYRQFHGRPKGPWAMTDFHVPKALIFLGQAIEIVYLSNKRHGGGDGTLIEYTHTFETPVSLYMDETGRTQLYLIGKKVVVTDNGIEN